jgi:hypothetical protein
MVTGELVSFEDLAPTMIHLAGSQVPSWLTGRILIGTDRSQPAEYLVLSSDRADNGIDLGDVREVAEVFVNGKSAGLLGPVSLVQSVMVNLGRK